MIGIEFLGCVMSRLSVAFLSAGVLAIAGVQAFAHHSMAEYDLFATTIEGTVQAFKYINPHSILILKESKSGRVWHLEGEPPVALVREGFSRNSLRPGDRLILQIQKLRSGKAGGYWNIRTIIMQNRHEFIGHMCVNSPGGCEQQ
jgi:hypothetical protein